MKKTGLLLTLAALFTFQNLCAQWFPVRKWNDDMPRHTFSLGVGPALYKNNNPLRDTPALRGEKSVPVGMEAALRYDWSYFRGYEVSLGAGLIYSFAYSPMRFEAGRTLDTETRIAEMLHYAGINLIDTKMWFGRRIIWDVSINAGYLGGSTRKTWAGGSEKAVEHGFLAGVSTGLDFLITAWLGVGVHFNAGAGMLYTQGSDTSREYSRTSLRLGAVYCF